MPTVEELDEIRRDLSAAIGQAKKAGQDASHLIARHREVGRRIERLRSDEDAATAGEIVTETICDAGTFRDLRREWTDLVERSDVATPFVLWEWLWPWWSVYGAGRELLLVASRLDGRLVGVAPLMVGLSKRGKLDRSLIGFVGTGERAEGDYFSLIVDRGLGDQVRRALWDEISELMGRDGLRLCLQHVVIGNHEADGLTRMAAADGAHIGVRPGRNSVLGPLPGTFEEFLQAVPSKNRRYYLRYQRERLTEALGEVVHQVAEDQPGLDRVLVAMERFSRQRLAREKQESAWADERFVRCMRLACPLMLERGALRAESLDLDGEPIAALIGFVHGATYFCYQMALDPAHAERSPGHCLIELCIRWCIEEGLDTFDFLAGEHEYKRSYFSGRRRLADVSVFWPTPRSLWRTGLGYIAEACKSKAKSVLGRA